MADKVVIGKTHSFLQFGSQIKVVENKSSVVWGWLPLSWASGKTVRQMLLQIENNEFYYKRVEEKFAILKQEFPQITLGYLGNISVSYNDTTWMIFLPHGDRVGTYADCVGSYYPWDFEQFYLDWDERIVPEVRKKMEARKDLL